MRSGQRRSLVRKVRTPQGGTLANGQAERSDDQCNREQTADGPSGHR